MKKRSYNTPTLILCLMLLIQGNVFAGGVTKRIAKSFNLKADTKIEISNKFGNVVINKWDKNVFDLKVEIIAEAKTDAKTQKLLDEIEIEITDRISSGSLSIASRLDLSHNGNSNFSINYEISMPNTNPLKLTNSFGNVYMGSYVGDLDVDVRYGQFQAEDLERAKLHIEFSNAKCEVETLKSGNLDLRYSKMSIDDLGDVEIESQFSDLEIGNAGKINLDGRYGKFEIGNVASLHGDIQFSGLDIKNLQETLVLETRHGNGISIDKVSSKFKIIDIEGEFSSIDLNMTKGTKALLDFELEFGNLKSYGEGINFNKVIKESNRSEYEGYLGSKDATATMNIRTKHGNIKVVVE